MDNNYLLTFSHPKLLLITKLLLLVIIKPYLLICSLTPSLAI